MAALIAAKANVVPIAVATSSAHFPTRARCAIADGPSPLSAASCAEATSPVTKSCSALVARVFSSARNIAIPQTLPGLIDSEITGGRIWPHSSSALDMICVSHAKFLSNN
jgi:hypothetical protein